MLAEGKTGDLALERAGLVWYFKYMDSAKKETGFYMKIIFTKAPSDEYLASDFSLFCLFQRTFKKCVWTLYLLEYPEAGKSQRLNLQKAHAWCQAYGSAH